jgi:zinc protease
VDAKSGWLQSQQVSRSQDNYLTSTLNNYLDINRTMMWNKELEDKITGLTAKQISDVFAKYVKPENITYVKAGDFAKNATLKP